MSTDTALRLGRYLNTSPDFWLNLQRAYDVETQERALASELAKITPRELEAA